MLKINAIKCSATNSKEITMIFVSPEKKFQVRLATVLTFLSGVGVPLPCVDIISRTVKTYIDDTWE